MIELELLGSHADGSQLVFTDPEGKRYLVTIDDALKAKIRRHSMVRDNLPQVGKQLSPRQIQQLLRAGMEPAEIAANYETDVARVERFAGPVKAERAYLVSKALEAPVGRESSAPPLRDLVIDRLATRGVDAESLTWSAFRGEDRPWQLRLFFIQSAKQCEANWEVSAEGILQRALDEEARWLTETTTPAAPPHVSNVIAGTTPAVGQPQSADSVEALLDELAAARGRRQTVDPDVDEPPLRLAASRLRNTATTEDEPTVSSPLRFVRYSRGAEKLQEESKKAANQTPSAPTPAAPTSGADTAAASGPTGSRVEDSPTSEQSSVPDTNQAGATSDGHAPIAAGRSPNAAVAGSEHHRGQGSEETATAGSEATSASSDDLPGTASSNPDLEAKGGDGLNSGVLPGLDGLGQADKKEDSPSPRPKRSKRRSVPAWDEIIFGSRGEE
ncbi:MAG: septation protein SepH [Actinomycetaceae bacterium]|nr:septation protein SepH [Actinomycetaceae bacterium]